jgi:hypothetical protein
MLPPTNAGLQETTLDEPVAITLQRELKTIGNKMYKVKCEMFLVLSFASNDFRYGDTAFTILIRLFFRLQIRRLNYGIVILSSHLISTISDFILIFGIIRGFVGTAYYLSFPCHVSSY